MATPMILPGEDGPCPRGSVGSADSIDNELVPRRTFRDEESCRLWDLEHAIQTLVRLSHPEPGDGIALRDREIKLTPAELRAFAAPHEKEVSFRADFAATLRKLVALQIRMTAESQSYHARQTTVYLWQQHVAALRFLSEEAGKVMLHSQELSELARARGLKQRIDEMTETCSRVGEVLDAVRAILKDPRLLTSDIPSGPGSWESALAQAALQLETVQS